MKIQDMLAATGLKTIRRQTSFWLALTLIMGVVSLAVIWVNMTASSAAIEVTQAQRMLSQRAAQQALLVGEGTINRGGFEETLSRFERNQRALLDGSEARGVAKVTGQALRDQLNRAGRLWGQYKEALQRVADGDDEADRHDLSKLASEVLGAVDRSAELLEERAAERAWWRQVTNLAMVAGILLLVLSDRYLAIFPTLRWMDFFRNRIQILSHGDFTQKASVQRDDEVGHIHAAYNEVLSEQGGFLQRIRQESDQIASSSEELSSTADQISGNAQSVNQQVEQVSGSISEVNDVVQDVANNIQSVSDSAQHSSHSTQEGKAAVDEASQQLQELNQSSERITDIISAIQNIAKKTDLLALNAAIEAANAGEAGKGFAVVADEVRKLAEQTNDATGQVNSIVTEVQSQSNASVEAMERVVGKMDELLANIEHTDHSANQIASAAEELAATMSETTDNMGEITTSVEQVTEGVQQIQSASQNLGDLALDLQQSLGLFRLDSSEQGAGGNSQNALVFRKAKSAHLAWRTKLRDFLNGEAALSESEATSHEECGLGQWLYSEGMPSYGHIPEMKKLEQVHKDLHGAIREIIQQKQGGQLAAANETFERFQDLSKQVIDQLDAAAAKVA